STFHAPSLTPSSTLSLHDALPISQCFFSSIVPCCRVFVKAQTTWSPLFTWTEPPVELTAGSEPFLIPSFTTPPVPPPMSLKQSRSQEHTSELQSRRAFACRLLRVK